VPLRPKGELIADFRQHEKDTGSPEVQIAVLTERIQQRLRVYRIEPDGGRLTEISSENGLKVFEGASGEEAAPMGIALYRRPRDRAIFAIVGRKSGPLRVARNACSTEMAELERTTDDVAALKGKIGYHRFPEAALRGDVERGLVVAGQIVGMVRDLPRVRELVSRIVREAAETLGHARDAVV